MALAREIDTQQYIAMFLSNLANDEIQLGQLSAARAGLREALTLAHHRRALPLVVGAVMNFANLAYAEGQIERALRSGAWRDIIPPGAAMTSATST